MKPPPFARGEATDAEGDATHDALGNATRLLRSWRAGDAGALETLTPLVYRALRDRARRHLARERAGHSLSPTELVHEVFMRLMDADMSWQDRAHFLAVASKGMRRTLVNHARDRGRQKRGGGMPVEVLVEDNVPTPSGARGVEILALDGALKELARRDARKARLVELSYFGGLTMREIAEVTGRSKSAIQRDLDFAKAWLHRRLSGAGRGPRNDSTV